MLSDRDNDSKVSVCDKGILCSDRSAGSRSSNGYSDHGAKSVH